MRRTFILALCTLLIATAASISFGLWEISPKGTWPDSWPKELKELRNQSRTLRHHTGEVHEIPFHDRNEFEAAWPHILSIKSNQAPLKLLTSPDALFLEPIKAGVRILSPSTGTLYVPEGKHYPPGAESAIPGGQYLRVGPPWPDYIKSESGALPQYVVEKDGKWVPYIEKMGRKYFKKRGRIDIQLIVDGEIVDLNRIPLPPDTPIIDERFKDGHNEQG